MELSAGRGCAERRDRKAHRTSVDGRATLRAPSRYDRAAPLVRRPATPGPRGTSFDGALIVDGGRIVDVRTGDERNVGPLPDAALSTPTSSRRGSCDLQVNGAFGFEVGGDPVALRALAAAPAGDGRDDVPADPGQQRRRAYARRRGGVRGRARHARRAHARASPGRAVAVARRGPASIDADGDRRAGDASSTTCGRLLGAGVVRLVTLAPERPARSPSSTGCAPPASPSRSATPTRRSTR